MVPKKYLRLALCLFFEGDLFFVSFYSEESDASASPLRKVPVARGRKPGSLRSADSGRDDTKTSERSEESDASASSLREVPVAPGRKPGSLRSADCGRDDTKSRHHPVHCRPCVGDTSL